MFNLETSLIFLRAYEGIFNKISEKERRKLMLFNVTLLFAELFYMKVKIVRPKVKRK